MSSQGKYEVIRKLDAGGMAEVYVGRTRGVAGITKRVAIKRVLPHLAENQKFVSMFLDEARVGMKLSHANVVQVFDVGEAEGTYFIVMEFIEGVSLRDVIDKLKERGQVVPVGTAAYIVSEAAKGLAYAHKALDDSGEPLGIVHRDISPPNILLSAQGEVKVTDFGLAKAASQLETTDPGVVKGKFSYLSPEAVDGLDVDPRADIFGLGIVLFELLTGRRLFFGETDYQTVELVSRCHVPSLRMLNRAVPELLDDIAHKALSRDRRLRYQHAEELGDALTSCLYTSGMKATSRAVADLVAAVKGDAKSTAAKSLAEQLMREELFGGIGGGQGGHTVGGGLMSGAVGDSIIDTRDWIGDLGLDEEEMGEQPSESEPAEELAPERAEHPSADRSAVEGKERSGFFRRLFGDK
jgi:serine/threonine-protein kinase